MIRDFIFGRRFTVWDIVCMPFFLAAAKTGHWMAAAGLLVVWVAVGVWGERA